MMQRQSVPDLDIVPVRSLILHEDVEPHRVAGIVNRFQQEKTLRNPPIVGRNQGRRRLIVLDGASRVTAARRLGFPHLLVQLLPYPSPEIGLDPWHHVVVGMSWSALVARAAAIPGALVVPMPWREAATLLEERHALACLRAPGKPTAVFRLAAPRRTGLRPLRELTRLYATDPGLHRVREDQLVFPREWLGEERVLVIFPRFPQEEIVRIALRLEDRLPMGITRHTVPNRALRVHYPLHWLRSNRTMAEKRRHLARFLEERWSAGRIRHYPESTTLYDE
jgi:L-serine kinase (ATP) / ParB family transcriptional regulator, heme-responsive regulator